MCMYVEGLHLYLPDTTHVVLVATQKFGFPLSSSIPEN